ncbi:aminoglycoside phosphotransferase family protein [Marmoricola sp. RAF53]|uniref:aminoglycoside phosphotransferase family protein n=1 Tax=Marmoricola sp. RAF53 TaxID=3233059 RepID=UPI003F98636B
MLATAERGPDRAAWVDRLPGLLNGLLEEWELTREGQTVHGFTAVVVPVITRSGRPAALKVAFPDEETELEHLALTRWNGDGAVQLLRADPHRRAMLLEHLRDVSLLEAWDLEACRVVAELYGRLHVPAPAQFRRLSGAIIEPLTRLRALERNAPLPRRMVEQAISLAGDFVRDEATDGTLVHTDLHYANVLLGDRETWLAIDPKPLSGDPHFEVAPMLWNRSAELAGDLRNGIRRRFHTLVDEAGLDEDRARDWVVVRMVMNALWRLTDDRFSREIPDDDWLTLCIAVAKAVQD